LTQTDLNFCFFAGSNHAHINIESSQQVQLTSVTTSPTKSTVIAL